MRRIPVRATAGCASRFQVVPSDQHSAKADGRYVQLTTSLVAYTRDDHELAALVAHELAHNILQHRTRLNEAGVNRDAVIHSPRDARLFQLTEFEADRLAVHLMERAGYDPAAAVRLWTRQGRDGGDSKTGSHPSWGLRISAMEAEIAALCAAKAAGVPDKQPIPQGPLQDPGP
jgi:predicted Zn-dependent protease